MEIYEVTLRSSYFGQSCINVFHYITDGTGAPNPSSSELLQLMGFALAGDPPVIPAGTVFSGIQQLVSSSVSFLEVEARNLYSVTDFFLIGYSPAIAGAQAGQGMPPFNAYGLRSNRIRTDVRRSTKRFAGVIESFVDDGGVLSVAATDAVEALAASMSDVLEGTFEANYFPSTLAFEKYTTPSDKTAYRPYATVEQQLEHSARGIIWAGYPNVRSQVSRQYGRGA